MVKMLSEIALSSLPNFWRISKSFMDGKFKRVRSSLRVELPLAKSTLYLSRKGPLDGARRNAKRWRST
jgi:hypothetical protein